MDTLLMIFDGFKTALEGWNILYCIIGVSLGMLLGILPGIGPVAGIAMLIPITYGLNAVPAIIMLSGIYYGTMYGGTITSVLLNIPGEAASVITCIDGYQMARQGRAGTALGVAAIGSFIGGVIAVIGLAYLGPPLAVFALRFGPPEFFSLLVLSFFLLIALIGKSLVRGILAAVLGLLISLIGIDPVSGVQRFTFGITNLFDGIDFVVAAMGMFGISEILLNTESPEKIQKPAKIENLFPRKEEWIHVLKAIGRGTGIGFGLGILPGANAVISTLVSYAVEKKVAKDPSRFGKGAIEGVAAPETANNAFSGGALIPLFTLGIPTAPAVAVLFGAFITHGLQPGPTLFTKDPHFVWAVIASMFIGNVILLAYNLPLARLWAKTVLIPYKILFPLILIVAMTGAYSINNSSWDVGLMVLFGLIGYLMNKLQIPLAPLILTFILGKQLESSLRQSLIMSESGSLSILFQRPLSGSLLGILFIVFLVSAVSYFRRKRTLLPTDIV